MGLVEAWSRGLELEAGAGGWELGRELELRAGDRRLEQGVWSYAAHSIQGAPNSKLAVPLKVSV